MKLSKLFEQDETAWLEQNAQLLKERRYEEIDHGHLRTFLLEMARRDKREVASRLTQLLAHLLKLDYTSGSSRSWQVSVLVQQRELKQLLTSKVLRNHAEA